MVSGHGNRTGERDGGDLIRHERALIIALAAKDATAIAVCRARLSRGIRRITSADGVMPPVAARALAAIDRANAVAPAVDLAHVVGWLAAISRDSRAVPTVFAGPHLFELDATGCIVPAADIADLYLEECRFDLAMLRGSRFCESTVVGGSFVDANLAETDWRKARVADVCFRGVDLSGALTEGAEFVACDFRGARLPAQATRVARLIHCQVAATATA